MQHFTGNDLQKLTGRYRAQLVNSLSGFKSANLIGTHNSDFTANLAIMSSVFHLGANPALIGFIMRPDNGERHTLENIINFEHYTINHVSRCIFEEAHQCSARYPRGVSEFKETGLSEQYINGVNAPFVHESLLKYALKLKEIVPITINDTKLIIGEIIHVTCQEEAIQQDGYIDIEALQTVSISGLDSYHSTERLSRLSYAKPGKPLSVVTFPAEG